MLAKNEIRKIRNRERKSDSWPGQNEEKLVGKDRHGGSRPSQDIKGLNVHTHSNKGRQRGRMISD